MRGLEDYQRLIRKLEIEAFPELAEDDFSMNHIDDGKNVFFTPNAHFSPKHPLLTEEIITDLRENNKNLLSVGSGPAYLELLLVKKLGINLEQLTLTDISNEYLPSGFESHLFDMYEEWPSFGKLFDYVIFPESVLINTRFKTSSERRQGLYHIISNSLDVMKEQGEIRINGHCQLSDNVCKVADRLVHKYPCVKVTYYDSELLTVTKTRVESI